MSGPSQKTSRHEKDLQLPDGLAPLARPAWAGALSGKRPSKAECVLKQPIQPSRRGGSGAFLGAADNGKQYYIKTLNNDQAPRVCVTEQIVGRIGALIGAPTCTVATIEIPTELAGWAFMPSRGLKLEPGIAHASENTPSVAFETSQLERRTEDDNASRHAYIIALYDLCWGDDCQWLVRAGDFAYTSHDHGWYLPPNGPHWTEVELGTNIQVPHMMADGGKDLSTKAVEDISARLQTLKVDDLLGALGRIPATWPVSDAELEAVGHFVLSRAADVAKRMETTYLGGAP